MTKTPASKEAFAVVVFPSPPISALALISVWYIDLTSIEFALILIELFFPPIIAFEDVSIKLITTPIPVPLTLFFQPTLIPKLWLDSAKALLIIFSLIIELTVMLLSTVASPSKIPWYSCFK